MSKHETCGMVCQHSNMKYCTHCDVPYCKDCGKEWRVYTWSQYSYYPNTYYSNSIKYLNSQAVAQSVNTIEVTCKHEE